MKHIRSLIISGLIILTAVSAIFAQQNGSISGQVSDTLGASVVGATVTAVAADGKEKTTTTNQDGDYTITGLAPGIYTVRFVAVNFAYFENTEVEVKTGARTALNASLTVQAVQEQVDISSADQVSTDPENNGGATVLKEQDLESLPDDPDELETALQALAGPSAGPNGGQIYIDGFTGGRLPPKDAIREIRINQNPFSAEFDRLGFGRIEILTKPGSDKWRGQAFLNFNDARLNSRNPFSINRAPSQTKFYGGNISGPVQKGKSSFFLDVSNRQIDSNTVVNAQILDPAFNVTNFRQEYQVPNRRLSISPRFDYQINQNNTLVARYGFTRSTFDNQGIGDTSLATRAFQTESTEHEFRLTETMIINPKTVNETRFQYEIDRRDQTGDNSVPTITVPTAFVGGGAQIGLSYNHSNSYELQNYTTTSVGANSQHALKFGVRLRGVTIKDRSENNFGGNFTFTGIQYRSDANGRPLDAPIRLVDGTIVEQPLSPIQQYRQKLLGNTDPRFNPNLFTISTGQPLADVSQRDIGLFITDDWRVSPALTLSFGLRYENQNNIKDNSNFAPRLSFAWSPGAGGARTPKTVIRGGAGIFYERFGENFTLQTERFNGVNQLNYIVNAEDNNAVRQQAALALLRQPTFTLNGVTNVPTAAQIQSFLPSASTVRTTFSGLQAPMTFQTTLGVERQLPARTTLSLFYIASRTWHQLRIRNINAPICSDERTCATSVLPTPGAGNIFQYDSSGILNQQQILINFRTALSPGVSFFGNYRLGFAKGDTDGANNFPAYTYNLSEEYGRSAFDIRHNFFIGGSFTAPFGVTLSPFITANSGRPFNITRGLDVNGDTIYAERPTFGELRTRCNLLNLSNSFCDIGDNDPNAVIPRNYGQSPKYFSVNLRVNKNFGFGSSKSAQTADGQQPNENGTRGNGRGGRDGGAGGGGGRGGRGGGGGGGFGGFGGGGFGGGNERKPYNLNVGLIFNNLFNNVNFGTPIGQLNSPFLGQSRSTNSGFGFGGGASGAANRRVELQMRFSF